MAGSGYTQTFSFGGTNIPNLEDVKSDLKGQIQSKVVALSAFPLVISVPNLGKFTVTFVLPTSSPATLLAAIAKGTEGAILHEDVDGVKYTASSGLSNGYSLSAPSGGFVTYTAEFVASGSVVVAAAT